MFQLIIIIGTLLSSFDRTEKTDLFQYERQYSHFYLRFDRTEKTDLFQLIITTGILQSSFDRTEKTDLFQ